MNVGDNDGACTKQTEFSLGVGTPAVTLTMAARGGGWVVDSAEVQSSAASPPASADLGQEMEDALQGLKIPCE